MEENKKENKLEVIHNKKDKSKSKQPLDLINDFSDILQKIEDNLKDINKDNEKEIDSKRD